MQIEIEGNGKSNSTRVVNKLTKEEIEGIFKVEIILDANKPDDNRISLHFYPSMVKISIGD